LGHTVGDVRNVVSLSNKSSAKNDRKNRASFQIGKRQKQDRRQGAFQIDA
jgi:hypothetical protein